MIKRFYTYRVSVHKERLTNNNRTTSERRWLANIGSNKVGLMLDK